MDKKQLFENKKGYVEKLMKKNREIKSLTSEQHNVLEWLCKIRHEIHCSTESIWYGNSNSLKSFDNSSSECEVIIRLKEVGLKDFKLNFDYVGLPTEADFECLSENEQLEWEEKADNYNNEHPNGMGHSSLSLWREESWEYQEFVECLEDLNTQIEYYLKEIDEEYGTNYCPSGHSRLL